MFGKRFSRALAVATAGTLIMAATTFAADLSTEAVLGTQLDPTTVEAGEDNAFGIKVWLTGHLNAGHAGQATIVNKYFMAADGTISASANASDTTVINFTKPMHYTQDCDGTPAPLGCASNPHIVSAVLSVHADADTTGTLTVAGTGSNGVGESSSTWDQGYVVAEQTQAADTTAPTTTASVTAGTLGSNGWYTSNVTVSLTATDNAGGSGLKQITYSASGAQTTPSTTVTGSPTTVSITTEGLTTISFNAEDNAGNIEATKTFEVKLDKTAPTLSPTVSPNPVLRGGSATATPNASDGTAGSGIASSHCDAVDTSTLGSNQTVTCYATDNAGLSNSATATYSVVLSVTGFDRPVDMNVRNVAKAGQAIPLKFQVSDALGPVADLTIADVFVKVAGLTCDRGTSIDEVEEYATGTSGLQNLGGGYYQFNWATPKTYASSCKTMTLTAGGGTKSATFEFKK